MPATGHFGPVRLCQPAHPCGPHNRRSLVPPGRLQGRHDAIDRLARLGHGIDRRAAGDNLDEAFRVVSRQGSRFKQRTSYTFSNLNHASGYSQPSFNVASFAGQTVTLKSSGTEDSSLPTSFVSTTPR